MEINKCKFCKKRSEMLLVVSGLKPAYKFNKKKTFSYYKCKACGIVFISPLLSEKEIVKEVYNESYFKEAEQNFLQKILFKLFLYKDYPEWVEVNIRKGSILDFGCGTGDFLKKMQKRGWDVYGTEVNSTLVKNAKRNIGKDRIFSTVNQYKGQRFDVITLWHVLEHLQDPHSFAKLFNSSLKKTGKLFIEVPNADSYVFKVFKQYYTWLRIPDHVYYYSPETIQELLFQAGFKKISISSPLKANLNFSFSLLNFWRIKKLPFQKIIFIFSIPISALISFTGFLTTKGEVLRVVAEK